MLHTKPAGDPRRKYLLASIAVVAVVLFLLLPVNRGWLQNRILVYGRDFFHQAAHRDEEYRKKLRWKKAYRYAKQISAFFDTTGRKGRATVMIPPTAYFQEHGIQFHVPEPAVFYYYTGLRTTWAHHSKSITANWYVRVLKGRMVVDSVSDVKAFHDSLARFRKYPYTL